MAKRYLKELDFLVTLALPCLERKYKENVFAKDGRGFPCQFEVSRVK